MPKKPKRRWMKTFKIDELSGVDIPAQEGARALIMKRATHDEPASTDAQVQELQEAVRSAVQDAISKANTALEGDNDMSKNEQTSEQKLSELQKQLDRANSIAQLSAVEKAHFDSLSDEEAENLFLAKSSQERHDEIDALAKAAADADPVVYTTLDGLELRKSAGEAFISMAKSNDTLRKQVEESREQVAKAALEKRAEMDLQHIPGDLETRVELLKSVDGIEDDTRREAALNALKAHNDAMASAFDTHGHSGQPEPGSPEDEIDKLAKQYASDNKVTFEAAYDAVLKTAEGSKLYTKSLN